MKDTAIAGQVVSIYPHPSATDLACLNCEPEVAAALRALPTAPSIWYAPSIPAYLLKGRDVGHMIRGLQAHGAIVASTYAAPDPDRRPSRPPWCGECEERTRLRDVTRDELGYPLTLTRCPECHPARHEPLPGMTGRHDVEPEPDPESYAAGLAEVRAEMRRLGLNGRYRRALPAEEPVTLGEMLADLAGAVPDEEADEAHPF